MATIASLATTTLWTTWWVQAKHVASTLSHGATHPKADSPHGEYRLGVRLCRAGPGYGVRLDFKKLASSIQGSSATTTIVKEDSANADQDLH